MAFGSWFKDKILGGVGKVFNNVVRPAAEIVGKLADPVANVVDAFNPKAGNVIRTIGNGANYVSTNGGLVNNIVEGGSKFIDNFKIPKLK